MAVWRGRGLVAVSAGERLEQRDESARGGLRPAGFTGTVGEPSWGRGARLAGSRRGGGPQCLRPAFRGVDGCRSMMGRTMTLDGRAASAAAPDISDWQGTAVSYNGTKRA